MFKYFRTLKRLSELEEEFEKLKKRQNAIELEWEDTYDRVKRLFHRVAKRAQRLEGSDAGDSEEGNGVAPTEAAGDALTTRQRQVNAQILARRNRGTTQ